MVGSQTYLVRWGSPELKNAYGQFFNKQTEFIGGNRFPILFGHGADSIVGSFEYGHIDVEPDDLGLKVSGFHFDTTRDEAGPLIMDLLIENKLSWSPGIGDIDVIGLNDGRSAYIDRARILEASLVTSPAEPWLMRNPDYPVIENNGVSKSRGVDSSSLSASQWMDMQIARRKAYIDDLKQRGYAFKSGLIFPDQRIHSLSRT